LAGIATHRKSSNIQTGINPEVDKHVLARVIPETGRSACGGIE
jgi:hypothetical protein